MVVSDSRKYDVGGLLLDRPFKIRRLGHFGFNAANLEACAHFYVDLMGFRVSDPVGARGFFLRHGSDHHSLVLFNRTIVDEATLSGPGARHYRPENDINQITWQLQSLREVVDATAYFRDLEMEIIREGRAGGPGSNYHLYFYDPDEQIDVLYYGIEQIGWDGHSKPVEMRHGLPLAPTEPRLGEFDEVQSDLAAGVDIMSGYLHEDPRPPSHDVDGILLPSPFRVIRTGPVNLFANDVEKTKEHYLDVLGLDLTEEVEWRGERCSFLRCDGEHHSLGIFPKSWRDKLELSPATSSMSTGLQVANYRQLRDAVSFLRLNGVRVETNLIPPELHPGIDHAAYAFDPDGRCLELYYSMERVGWDGQPRPRDLRRRVDPNQWPEQLEPTSDTYRGEPFLGPWR